MIGIEKFNVRASQLVAELPWPPSVNNYYTVANGRKILSRQGKAYKQEVGYKLLVLKLPKLTGRLKLRIVLYPPDNIRRDIDNIAKAVLDALSPYLYVDDSQIDHLIIKRDAIKPKGLIFITITEI